MNSVSPQSAHDAKPANPRRVSMISSLLVSGSSAPSGLMQDRKSFMIGLARRSWDARSTLCPGNAVVFAGERIHARGSQSAPRVGCSKSADDQRRVLALAFAHAARVHPVVGAVEQCHVVIIDVLVAHERPQ